MYNKAAACVRSVGEGSAVEGDVSIHTPTPTLSKFRSSPPHTILWGGGGGGRERAIKKNELSDQEALSNIIRQKERWNLEEINLLRF
jgi:hypothetical protein